MGYIGCKESCDNDRMSKGLFTLMEAKPTLIKERVCKRVIGQDEAVSRTVDNLMLMAKTKVMREKGMSPFATPRQSSFCIIGPTASGKTHMVKVICDVLDMPLFSVDCTALTGTGWRGGSVNDFMKPVYGFQQAHPGEFCVVFFDEADKMRLREKDSELTFCPQQSFLMLLESDGPYDINTEYNTSESLYINTNLILFVFGGAFTGIEKTVADRLASEKRGFTPVTSSFFAEAEGAALRKKVTIDDLVAYGMLSEFCGRIGEIIYMHPLDETSLRKILCEGEFCLEKQLTNVMPKGCRYELDESAVAHVVKEALQAPLGVRGLGNALAPTASQALSIMRENPQITHITVWYDDVSGDFLLNEGCLEDDASIVPTPNDYEHIEELNEMD